jgi:hypothetical protein
MRNQSAQSFDATPRADDTQPTRTAKGERTRLYLVDVENPIVTKVAERHEGGMTCVQELPFLRIESLVEDDRGRKARIARVSVAVEKNVPKLVIELAYDDEDDDDDSTPPGVAFGSIEPQLEQSGMRPMVLEAWEPRAFLPSPIDSMREPPVSFTKLIGDFLSPLTKVFAKLAMPQLQLA